MDLKALSREIMFFHNEIKHGKYLLKKWSIKKEKVFKDLDSAVEDSSIFMGSPFVLDYPSHLFFDWAVYRMKKAHENDMMRIVDIPQWWQRSEMIMLECAIDVTDNRNIENLETEPIVPPPLYSYFENTPFDREEPVLRLRKKLQLPEEKPACFSFISHFSKKRKEKESIAAHEIFLKKYNAIVDYNAEIEKKNKLIEAKYKMDLENYNKEKNEYYVKLYEKYPMDEKCFESEAGIENYFCRVIDNIDTTFLFKYEIHYIQKSKKLHLKIYVPTWDDLFVFGAMQRELSFFDGKIEMETYTKYEVESIFSEIYKQVLVRITNDIYISDTKNNISNIFLNAYIINSDDDEVCIGRLYTEKKDFFEEMEISYEGFFSGLKGEISDNLYDKKESVTDFVLPEKD